MNELAREKLIQAGLSGHKQVRHVYHGDQGGECAMGILHLALHASRDEAVRCRKLSCIDRLGRIFELTARDAEHILWLNDVQGIDFIGIARKMGDEEPCALH